MRAGKGFIETLYVLGGVHGSSRSFTLLLEDEKRMLVLSRSLIRLDSTSMPHRPPPKNMIEMETCSRSWADHALPHADRCSRNTFVDPYRKMTNDSTNSAEGILAFRALTTPTGGLIFQAHPISAKQPIHRPRVRRPYQKKMPPLMKWARPLKILFPRCSHLVSVADLSTAQARLTNMPP